MSSVGTPGARCSECAAYRLPTVLMSCDGETTSDSQRFPSTWAETLGG